MLLLLLPLALLSTPPESLRLLMPLMPPLLLVQLRTYCCGRETCKPWLPQAVLKTHTLTLEQTCLGYAWVDGSWKVSAGWGETTAGRAERGTPQQHGEGRRPGTITTVQQGAKGWLLRGPLYAFHLKVLKDAMETAGLGRSISCPAATLHRHLLASWPKPSCKRASFPHCKSVNTQLGAGGTVRKPSAVLDTLSPQPAHVGAQTTLAFRSILFQFSTTCCRAR